jgi:hypothetical protein
MKRSASLQRKTPLKGGGFLKRGTRLAVKGSSDAATIKDSIQSLLRDIVIIRDGGCILRNVRHCNGIEGQAVLQADHLITRANSATFADHRLVVCVCRSCHGWKSLGSNQRKAQYDELVKTLIEPERVALWETCERDSWRPHRTSTNDWKLQEVYLKAKLTSMRRVIELQ